MDSANTAAARVLLNQKQTAEAVGLSTGRLSQLRKAGRIHYADPVRRLYDLDEVRAALRQTADVRQVIATETRRQVREAQAAAPAPAPVPPMPSGSRLPATASADDAAFDEDEPEYGLDHHENYKIAASFEKREAARIARIERLKLEGAVGMVADMEREAYTEARIIRDTLLGALPTKLAPQLAAITDPFALEQALREGLRAALHDIVRQVEDANAPG